MAVADGRGRPQGVCGDDAFPPAAQADPVIACRGRMTPNRVTLAKVDWSALEPAGLLP
jgi:hypothetical protein